MSAQINIILSPHLGLNQALTLSYSSKINGPLISSEGFYALDKKTLGYVLRGHCCLLGSSDFGFFAF
jgi:hypothetical protein